MLRDVDLRGQVIKQQILEAQAHRTREENNLGILAAKEAVQTRISERMRLFHKLMNLAQEEEAYRQSEGIRRDLINQGVPVPQAVTASGFQSLVAYNFRELQELRRVRQEQYLRAEMGVERSAVPMPDEPPVLFPPAATWKEITRLRKNKYESSLLGGEEGAEDALRIRDIMSQPVKFGGVEDAKDTLKDVLDHLTDRYGVRFVINEDAFAAENAQEVGRTAVADQEGGIPKMQNVALSTVLRRILSEVTKKKTVPATWIIRRDEVEITTAKQAASEMTIRAYPVADLVIPVPNSYAPQGLLSGGGPYGGFSGFGGVGMNPLMGGFGGLGLGGLGMGGLGMGGLGGLGGLGMGGLGGLGGLGGIPGMGGIPGIGGMGGMGGVPGMGGLGIQGGQGMGMGVLGNTGMLGGGLGMMGGTRSPLLLDMIRNLVGDGLKDWAPMSPLQQIGMGVKQGQDEGDQPLTPGKCNLTFYLPAMCLVVKGSSRIHTNLAPPIAAPGADVKGALDRRRDDAFVGKPPVDRKDEAVRVAGRNEERPDPPDQGGEMDPKVVWQKALAQGVEHPGMIIACADFLALNNKWDHAAEFLKADIRQGIVVKPWVYQALAVALRQTKASAEEIERAEVSAADLEPLDAQGFLRAAEAVRQSLPDRALAFCRQAALLEPNLPNAFRDALVCAEQAKDSAGMAWAAGNLLQRDWPADNEDLHQRAKERIKGLTRQLEKEQRLQEAQQLQATLAQQPQRDLVIQMAFLGNADLDLRVEEPIGSVCSWLNRQTVGGGTLLGGTLTETNRETYVAAKAFNGAYKVTIDRAWGRPTGGRVQLRLIRHQGTPQEQMELMQVNLDDKRPITVTLTDGRRTEAATVPPPAAPQRPREEEVSRSDRVLTQLRTLADPNITGVETGGIRGGLGSYGISTPPQLPERSSVRSPVDPTAYQTKVLSMIGNGADLTTRANLSADRNSIRLSLSPLFDTVKNRDSTPNVYTPLIPGAPPK